MHPGGSPTRKPEHVSVQSPKIGARGTSCDETLSLLLLLWRGNRCSWSRAVLAALGQDRSERLPRVAVGSEARLLAQARERQWAGEVQKGAILRRCRHERAVPQTLPTSTGGPGGRCPGSPRRRACAKPSAGNAVVRPRERRVWPKWGGGRRAGRASGESPRPPARAAELALVVVADGVDDAVLARFPGRPPSRPSPPITRRNHRSRRRPHRAVRPKL